MRSNHLSGQGATSSSQITSNRDARRAMSKKRSVRAGMALAAVVGAASAVPLHAGDVNWNNGSSDFLWNTSSMNWTGAAWNNANGDGAIFGATGVGAINVTTPVNVNSLNFTVDGYSLSGSDITFVNGTSTQTTGVVNVPAGVSATINNNIINAVTFQKVGAGTATL